MESIIDIINRRVSVRTYENIKVEENKKSLLSEFIRSNNKGPFGNTVRFEFVEVAENDIQELKAIGTYGTIRGAALYLAGAVKNTLKNMEDFGYCMEKAILKATELGLGSVWLGGFFNRSAFADRIKLQPDEVLPAVSPLGYPAEKKSIVEILIRAAARASSRREFGRIFFDGNLKTPLEKETAGKYLPALEALRIGPSASNKQPWRIIKENGKDVFHFFLDENKLYNYVFKNITVQNLDMGIAMCHFEYVLKELGFQGKWYDAPPQLESGNLAYISTWSEL